MKLKVSERELLNPGYRRAYVPPADVGVELLRSGESRLSELKKGQRIRPKKMRAHHKGMTEAGLIAEMQKRAIGRPATYALIIETLLQRSYVERAGDGSLNITLRGRAVLEFLVSRYPSLFSVEFTAKMEAMLDGIASKRVSYGQVVGQFYQALS